MAPRKKNPAAWLLSAWHRMTPPALFVSSFAALIVVATLGLLVLPGLYTGPDLSLIDALFTATSAVCVTGLIVVDTATYFTFWGQLWLLVFIQLGGIGLVTLTTLIIGMLGRRLSLRSEVIAAPPVEVTHRSDVRGIVSKVTRFTLAAEAIGAVVLWLHWFPSYGAGPAAWHSIFHAVSAFCNAGFSTFSDSLISAAARPTLIAVISLLVILGGFGYLGGEEILRWLNARETRRPSRLSTHTYATLSVTAILLVGGTVAYALFEWNGVLSPMATVDRIANAWFMAVTPRTAGFNTVPYSELNNAAASFTLMLMFVGGSPGSTAGGLKTTTIAILWALAYARIRGRRSVELHDRTVPEGTVERTVSLVLVAFGLVALAVFGLTYTETRHLDVEQARTAFLPILFEAVSALCTVGLSMDATPALSPWGKPFIVLLMFIGRIGPLSFFAAISLRSSGHPGGLRLAREDIIVG